MNGDRSFADLLQMIENNRQDWLQNAPVASGLGVSKRTESLTVRLAEEEANALAEVAKRLGIAKSTLLRMIIREYLGLNRGSEEATTSRAWRAGHVAVAGRRVSSAGRHQKSGKA